MEHVVEQITTLVFQNGWQLALIALLGIILLGVLKYANVFNKVAKENRKVIYLAISIGFSIAGTVVYLLIIGQFDVNFLIGIAGTIFSLNQAMYAIYENTKLRDLITKLIGIFYEKLKAKGVDSK